MMGRSHALIGAATGLMFGALINPTPAYSLAFAAAAAVGSMLPDIDHRHAPIRRQMGFIGNLLLFWLPHRGITHSLLMALVSTGLFVVIGQYYGLAMGLGYVSHIVADMMTRKGVPLLLPIWDRKLHVLPPLLRITTGGFLEAIVTGGFCALALWVSANALGIVT